MKKKALSLIVVILCVGVLLSACSVDWEHAGEVFGVDPNETVAATQSTETPPPVTEPLQNGSATAPVTVPKGEAPGIVIHPNYQYGNMQFNSPCGNFTYFQGLVYFNPLLDDNQLCTYDPETGEVSLFCKDATCNHNSEKCAAHDAGSGLEAYNGRLFSGAHIGDEILELKNDRFEEVLNPGRGGTFWHAGNDLYVLTGDWTLLVYENGSNQPRTVLDEYVVMRSVGFGQYLYGQTMEGVVRLDLWAEDPQIEYVLQNIYPTSSRIDGHHIYYTSLDDKYIFRSNMDGSEPTLLYEQPVRNMNFDDEYLYFLPYPENNLYSDAARVIYRMRKSDPSEVIEIAELPEPADQIFTVPGFDKIFVLGHGNEENTRSIYTVAIDGSGWEKLELPEF